MREQRAAEEASRLQKQRTREEQVRGRQEAALEEKRAALEERMQRAETARDTIVQEKAGRARMVVEGRSTACSAVHCMHTSSTMYRYRKPILYTILYYT